MNSKKLQPLVSVLMTSYNREKYIAEAIESVLNSTYTNFELIIVDDRSKDATVSIARNYEEKDNRVKVYINDRNLGDYPNRNKAAGYSKGEYLMYVDSDDSIKSDAIEYVIKKFKEFPEAEFSLIYYHKDIKDASVLNSKQSIHKHFYINWFLNIGPGGTIIRSDYFKSIGRFPEKYGPANDMYYNLKAAANTNILLLPYEYLNYRIHENQEINNKYSYLCNNYRYLFDVIQLPEFPLSYSEKKKLLRKAGRQNAISFIRYILKTRELRKTFHAYKISGIKLKDIF